MATVKKMMKKSASKKAMAKKPAMKAPSMQPSIGGPGAMGAGGPMMKKGGKLKKAQNGAYTMKKFKKEFPKADTMPSGDLRFEDLAPLNRYDKQDQKFIMSNQKAFDTKYGKNKPATSTKKNKMGGTTKYKKGGTLTPSKKSVGKTFGKLNKAKSGSKMSKKK